MKKTIVVSAINANEGGILSILSDCLSELVKKFSHSYHIIALVHDSKLISNTTIQFINYPKAKKRWIYRIYYEYIHFYFLSKKLKADYWISLSDVSPTVVAKTQIVYCHCPAPFYKVNFSIIKSNPRLAFYMLMFIYVYRINLHKNKHVIVQQQWIKDKFVDIFKLNNVIVAKPIWPSLSLNNIPVKIKKKDSYTFFYPSLPRPFKNFELLLKAAEILNKTNPLFKVIITISGKENNYDKMLFRQFGHLNQVKWIGKIERQKVLELFSEIDCLVFPSKLETWGLPISEAIAFEKPILIGDLPYAHETTNNYSKIKFFNTNDANELAFYMLQIMENKLVFSNSKFNENRNVKHSWEDLLQHIII